MQSELPWNVAGIPAEAREAARAAARREGLSVGEWMTRRILRGFPDAAPQEAERTPWRPSLVDSPLPAQPEPVNSARDSQDMLERVSRSETESQNAYKAIDQQLKTVARRLESAERNQTENNRAMTQAATQINIAAREQAQAFEQMTTNVSSLAERLVRLERHAQQDGMKDAVKALHQGLSRVADQIAQTASQSAAQIAALADNVDSLASQVVAASEKTDEVALASETRFAALDDRLRVAERTAFTSASALDHTMENVERLRAMHDSLEVEVRQHATLMEQAKDDSDRLNATVADNVNEQAAAVARVEEAVERLQAENASDPLDLRLSGIEHVLTDIMGRLEQAEQVNANAGGTMEQTLRDLATGFETADERNRETIRELQSAVQDAATKIAAVEKKLSEPPPAPVAVELPRSPQPAPMGELILDAPPFPQDQMSEHLNADLLPPLGEHDLASMVQDFPTQQAFAASESPLAPPAFGDPLQDEQYAAPESGSFLDAARRSAQAAASEREQIAPGRSGGLNWTFPNKDSEPKQQGGSMKRYALAGSVFGVAVAAALAGVVLSHGVGSTTPQAVPSAAIVQQSAPTPAATRGSAETDAASTAAMDEGATPSMPPVSNVTSDQSVASAPNAAPQAAAELPAQRLSPMTPRTAQAAAGSVDAPPASPMQKLASLANTGDSKAQLLLGLKHLEGSGTPINEAEAARWLARAAQQGEPLAQYRLGTLYERGRGVAASPKLAAHWYELAAKQGNRKAMHNLAVAFAEGSGEVKDPVQAAVWFSRAANLGLADSEFNLAVLYERGMGVKQSLVDAYKWYLIAASLGDSESKARADALSTQLSDPDRAAAQQAASTFKPQEMNPAANSTPSLG